MFLKRFRCMCSLLKPTVIWSMSPLCSSCWCVISTVCMWFTTMLSCSSYIPCIYLKLRIKCLVTVIMAALNIVTQLSKWYRESGRYLWVKWCLNVCSTVQTINGLCFIRVPFLLIDCCIDVFSIHVCTFYQNCVQELPLSVIVYYTLYTWLLVNVIVCDMLTIYSRIELLSNCELDVVWMHNVIPPVRFVGPLHLDCFCFLANL